jgi:hypothetical protein
MTRLLGMMRRAALAAAATASIAAAAQTEPPPKYAAKVPPSILTPDTIHANDCHSYDEVDALVQNEPANAFDPETTGLFASIGISKAKPFAPDAPMKSILVDAVGNP